MDNTLFGNATIEELEYQVKELQHRYDYNLREWDVEVAVGKFTYKEDAENSFGKIIIPDYQRKYVWKKPMKCDFIESLFLGIPILPLLTYTLDDGNFELIDGVQRLSTIREFVKGDLILEKLQILDKLNGFSFKGLLPARQRKFNAISLRFYILSEKASPGIRADIFKRINSNGEKLTEAEIRKGAFVNNDFYKFVLECIELPIFANLYSSTKKADMQRGDKEELITRFFAYSESYNEFQHSVRVFLNEYIDKKGKKGFNKDEKLNELTRTFEFIKNNFENGFRKSKKSKSIPKVRFEAIAIGVNLALKEDSNIENPNLDWLYSEEFIGKSSHTTSDASNNKSKLTGRIEFVRDCLLGKITNNKLTFAK
ncbi:MAG: DUF262 domain-containing protein [Bacteroidales bacterium]|nr:DUF262 domain-containing protein [Bacteroidales bacterium]